MAGARVFGGHRNVGVSGILQVARRFPVATTLIVTLALFLFDRSVAGRWTGTPSPSPLIVGYWIICLGAPVFAVVAGGRDERLFGLTSLFTWHVLIAGAAIGFKQQAIDELALLVNLGNLLVLCSISLRQGPSWSLAATAFMAVHVALLLYGVADPRIPSWSWRLALGLFDYLTLAALLVGASASLRARRSRVGAT
jgi:hypothetical protein